MRPAKFFVPIFGFCIAVAAVANGQHQLPNQGSASNAPDLADRGHEEVSVAPKPAIAEAYDKLPLSFEANRGQTDSSVKFLSRGRGYTLFLTSHGEAVLVLHKSIPKRGALQPGALSRTRVASESEPLGPPAVVRMQLVSDKSMAPAEGLDQLPGKADYFVGNDPRKWQTNVPTFGKVRYREIYPGVDLVYYGNQRQLEHDFVVAPGADPRSIVLNFAGAEKLVLDAKGRLVLPVKEGEVRFEKPRIYQDVSGARREISGSYVLKSAHRAGFAVGAYDARAPLVIDPVLVYSTYLGGNEYDSAEAIAVDSSGNAYVTGATTSSNFPVVNAMQPTLAGPDNAFVAKINAAGSALVYSTYLGGSGGDAGEAIAVDSSGNAYVTGQTLSTNFPGTSSSPIQSSLGGYRAAAFVAKISAAGSALVYSTYLGGGQNDAGYGIAVDSVGNAYVTGLTSSTNFPGASSSTIQSTFSGAVQNAFVAKINAAGSALVYSTYLGGNGSALPGGGGDNGRAIAVDSSGNAYATGVTESTNFPVVNAIQSANGGYWNSFVAKINAAGSALVYSTYLGGSDNSGTAVDEGSGITVDSADNAYVTGVTLSTNFPGAGSSAIQSTLAGSQNAYVAKIDAAGSALVYSTYLGGSNHDYGSAIAVDSSGNAYVTGFTTSSNFPVVNAIQPTSGGGPADAFVAEINAAGSALVYSTYLGGSNQDEGFGIAVDSSGNAYVAGATESANFPVANAMQPTISGNENAFVAKIGPPTPSCTVTYSGTFVGNVNISSGLTCITNGTVTGSVSQNGGGLVTSNATIGGNLQITGGGTFSMANTAINGDLQVQNIPAGAAQNQICGTDVKGDLQFHNNGTAVVIGNLSGTCAGNKIGNDLQIQDNTASVQVFGDTVGGNLQCQNNSSITGGNDTAKQTQGQCTGF